MIQCWGLSYVSAAALSAKDLGLFGCLCYFRLKRGQFSAEAILRLVRGMANGIDLMQKGIFWNHTLGTCRWQSDSIFPYEFNVNGSTALKHPIRSNRPPRQASPKIFVVTNVFFAAQTFTRLPTDGLYVAVFLLDDNIGVYHNMQLLVKILRRRSWWLNLRPTTFYTGEQRGPYSVVPTSYSLL